jgi:glycosyltransferase involved in cell wall biosynthesis
VRFVGAVKAVDALYDKLSMLVIPSRSEGLPNVLLEALRKDLPVAATTVGAIPEVIDSPLAGALCEPGSAAQLADAIERALALRESTDAHAARRRVVARFSLDARARAHMRLYESVLGERVGRRA